MAGTIGDATLGLMIRRVGLSMACAGAALLAGCQGPFSFEKDDEPRSVAVDQSSPPADFAVAVTIYSPLTDPAEINASARILRPARYIVEPDGVLRASVGSGSRESTFPPIARRLSEEQIEALWRAIRDSGLLSPDSPRRIGSGEGYVPPSLDAERATTAVLYCAQNGDRGWWAVTIAGDGVDVDALSTLATRQLVERLARLSWAP